MPRIVRKHVDSLARLDADEIFEHPQLEQLRTMLHIPAEFLSLLVRHTSVRNSHYIPIKHNPIAASVFQILGIDFDNDDARIDLDEHEVYEVPEERQELVRNSYNTDVRLRVTLDADREDDRARGWRAIGAANLQFRELFGPLTDQILFELIHLLHTKRYYVLHNMSSVSRTDSEWDILSGLLRWVYGSVLGCLISTGDVVVQNTLPVSVVQQSYSPNTRNLALQAVMNYEWFSAPFNTSELNEGRGILPYGPFKSCLYEASKRVRAYDAKMTDDCLAEACEELKIGLDDARLSITLSTYEYLKYRQKEETEGMILINRIIELVQARSHRAYGATSIIWNQITQFFDVNAQSDGDRGRVPQEDIDRLATILVDHPYPTPEILLANFPNYAQHKLRNPALVRAAQKVNVSRRGAEKKGTAKKAKKIDDEQKKKNFIVERIGKESQVKAIGSKTKTTNTKGKGRQIKVPASDDSEDD